MVGRSRLRRREARAGYFFISPWLIGFSLFSIGPIIISLILSFSHYSVIMPPRFCGVQNYYELPKDPLFWKSLYNTAYMTVLGIPPGVFIAFAVALFLNMKVKGMACYRTIYYLPAIVPIVASSILWMWILAPRYGILNSALSIVHIKGPPWLGSETWSKPAIILMGCWGAGASMILYLAGLQGIPQQLYEAAQIDGANWWHQFWKITLPLMTPVLFFNVVMGVIGSMQIFTQAYIMTAGGPVDSTLFYVYYLFNNAFAYFRMGYACSLSWVLFVIILVITLLQLRMARYWVYYGGVK